MLPNDSAHYVCSPWQVALVTPLACTNLRWVLRPCLSKLAYMSHVVWPRERVHDGCLCSHRVGVGPGCPDQSERDKFEGTVAEVALGQVGISVGGLPAGGTTQPGCGYAGSACAGRYRRSPIPGGQQDTEICGVGPTYPAAHTTLIHPAYVGAYVYGRTRKERYLDPTGALRPRSRRLPRDHGGPHPRSSARVHRLGHLPGQP